MLAQQRERVGTVNMLAVLANESAWLTQRKLELDTQARRADLRVSLIKAMGGGFDAQAQGLAAPANTEKTSSLNLKTGNAAS